MRVASDNRMAHLVTQQGHVKEETGDSGNEPVSGLRLVGHQQRKDLPGQRPHDEDEDDRETPVQSNLDARDAADADA